MLTPNDTVTVNSLTRICTTCGHPKEQSSYDRHARYCRQRQNRLKVRQKACRACSVAKVRCSFEAACSRCVQKRLSCAYDHPSGLPTAVNRNVSASSGSTTEIVRSLDAFNSNSDARIVLLSDTHGWLDSFAPENSISSNNPSPPHAQSNSAGFWSNRGSHHVDETLNDLPYLGRYEVLEPLERQSRRLLMDALCAIPEQMRRRATLPPFIHGHWHRKELPEPLSVCMRIAQMFGSRTPATSSFLWRAILTEQRQALQMLPYMTARDLLAYVQAGIVYLIMRVIDGPTPCHEYEQEIASLQMVLCDRFLELSNNVFCYSENDLPSTSWEDWIFAESRRRTSSIWFLTTRTLRVKTKAGCPTREAPWTLPLPSSKLLWEARSEIAWMEEMTTDTTPGLSTFGQLMQSKQRWSERDHAQKLDAWNARADNFGPLLNIAVSVV